VHANPEFCHLVGGKGKLVFISQWLIIAKVSRSYLIDAISEYHLSLPSREKQQPDARVLNQNSMNLLFVDIDT